MPKDTHSHHPRGSKADGDSSSSKRVAEELKKKSGDASESPELLSHPSYEALLQTLSETEQKMNQHWERILRMQADNDNTARRVERDLANAHKYALEKFVAELIPIVDSLELCITSTPELKDEQANSILEGVNPPVQKSLVDARDRRA